MSVFKKTISLLLVLAMVFAFFPAKASATHDQPTSFSFLCHNKTGYVGIDWGTVGLLEYEFQPMGTSEAITMVSSDTSVATVEYWEDYDVWNIRYHKLGTAIITATTESGLTDQCVVTVKNMETISLDTPTTVTLEPYDHVLFSFTPEETANYTVYTAEDQGYVSINYANGFYAGGSDTGRLVKQSPVLVGVWHEVSTPQTITLSIKKNVPVEQIMFDKEVYRGYLDDIVFLPYTLQPVWSQYEEVTMTSSNENVARFDSEY